MTGCKKTEIIKPFFLPRGHTTSASPELGDKFTPSTVEYESTVVIWKELISNGLDKSKLRAISPNL
jgi:hypothetical protein